ncbi:MAG: hypothetical protein IIZ48_00890 [Erysipelotrichales bacterium]|nr:hypothetical protein [Erysipelotrichales bacterium]
MSIKKKPKLPEVYGIGVVSDKKGRVVYKHPLLSEARALQKSDHAKFTLLQQRYVYVLIIYIMSLLFLVSQRGYSGFIAAIIGFVAWLGAEIWFYLLCKNLPVNKARVDAEWTTYEQIVKQDKLGSIIRAIVYLALGILLFVYCIHEKYDVFANLYNAGIVVGCLYYSGYILHLAFKKQ